MRATLVLPEGQVHTSPGQSAATPWVCHPPNRTSPEGA